MQTTEGITVSDTTGTAKKKPAARKPAAATPDEELLAQQAQEEADGPDELVEGGLEELMRGGPDDKPLLPDPGTPSDEEMHAEREAAERRAEASLLQRLYLAQHPGADGLSDDELLERKEEILAGAVPAPAVDVEVPAAAPAATDLAAILAANNANMLAAVELLAEKLAGQRGSEVELKLEGSAEDLLRQLAGTVSDGGDGDEPLETPVTFISRGTQFKAIKKPRYRGVSPTGEQIFTTGVAADFAPHGKFVTRNPEMVAWLKSRPGMNLEFWIAGEEPFSAPNPKTVLDQIMDAMLEMDDFKLSQIEEDEAASHKRQVVLDAVRGARERVQRFAAIAAE